MQWLQWSILLPIMLILSLATLWIWFKLWQNRRQLAHEQQQQTTDLIASVKIIASAILKGRLEAAEGCHRLVLLLDQLSVHWRTIPSLRIIDRIDQLEQLQAEPDQAGKLHDLCRDQSSARRLQASELQRALTWLLQHNQTGYARILAQLKPQQ